MELGLVPTVNLLDALKARFDAVVFAAIAKEGERPHVDAGASSWSGNSILCVGLAMNLIRDIHDWEREGKPEHEEAEDG